MIKILLLTISIFLLILLESFFLKVFSFSVFFIITISVWRKVSDIWFFLYVTIVGIVLDTVLHIPLGVHMFVISFLLVMLESLWFLIPKDTYTKYIPVFFVFILYYILVQVISSLLLYSVFPEILMNTLIWIFIKGIVSVILCALIEHMFVFLRDSDDSSSIRLR